MTTLPPEFELNKQTIYVTDTPWCTIKRVEREAIAYLDEQEEDYAVKLWDWTSGGNRWIVHSIHKNKEDAVAVMVSCVLMGMCRYKDYKE